MDGTTDIMNGRTLRVLILAITLGNETALQVLPLSFENNEIQSSVRIYGLYIFSKRSISSFISFNLSHRIHRRQPLMRPLHLGQHHLHHPLHRPLA